MDVNVIANSARQLSVVLLAGALATLATAAPMAWSETGKEQGDPDAVSTITAEPERRHPRANSYMKRQWGIEILFVRQTAAGYMLEFRYKVLDAEKAKPLFERQTKPLLTHVESGAKLVVPTPAKTGALRNSNPPLADHVYWMFFANPGRRVQKGEHVNVEIGDFLVEGLVVQ